MEKGTDTRFALKHGLVAVALLKLLLELSGYHEGVGRWDLQLVIGS